MNSAISQGIQLTESHLQEFRESCIDAEIISLNFQSISGDEPYKHLIPDTRRISGKSQPDAQWRYLRKRFSNWESGGWWSFGIDILTGEDSDWGCFKPDTPRIDSQQVKGIKYEHPHGVKTQAFFLRVPPHIWELIARRYEVQLPDNYKTALHSEFWKWVISNPLIPVILCEGVKKAACLLSMGYVAIAIPGINSGYRIPKNEFGEPTGAACLIPQLQPFSQNRRRVFLCFDEDSKRSTIRAVNGAKSQTGKLFKLAGCEVKVMGWNSILGKGLDDVVFNHGEDTFHSIYRDAITLDEWQSKQLKSLTYKPNLSLNQKYLGQINLPQESQLIAIKAPKGSGKTQFFQRLTDPLIRSGEKRVLAITHRIQLGSQLGDRLGLPMVSELKESGQGSHFGMVLCVDSLHKNSQAKFNPEHWWGSWIILDEIQQLIWHLLNSSTCRNERVTIIKNLKKLLSNVVNGGGKIFVADADLNDVAIDFIRGLLGVNVNTFLIENTYEFEQKWNIHNFNDKNPSRLVKHLENRLALGEKHFVCLSGQKAKSKWGSRNLEAYFRERFPDMKILRIDSESVADPNHPAFGCTSDLNSKLIEYQLVLTTPTIETGVSIEIEHFDAVWGIFQGVQTTDSVRQHLSRYRLPVPRYLWIRQVGINRIGNGATTVKGLLSGEYKKDKANIRRLVDAGFEESFDDNFEPVCLTTWAKLAASINLGMIHYQKQILADLEAEGHIINSGDIIYQDNPNNQEELIEIALPNDGEAKNFKDKITAVCEIEYQKHREQVSEADSIPDTKYEKLSRQNSKNKQERLEYQKGELERRYNVKVDADLVEKDDDGWYTKIRLNYYFGIGREYLPDREKGIMNSSLKNGNGHYFLPDSNQRLLGNKVAALDWLGLQRLLEDAEYFGTHPVIQDIFDKCKTNTYILKLVLGLDFSQENQPMKVAQRLVDMVGLKFPYLRKKGKRGEQIRIYGKPIADWEKDDEGATILVNRQVLQRDDRRGEIFHAWLERDKLAREKAVAAQAEVEAAARAELEPWLEPEIIREISYDLQRCKSPEELATLRENYPAEALKQATRLLPSKQLEEIRAWILAA